MDANLRELYQEVILDHNKQPRNYRVLEPATHQADGHNPLCGDRVRVFLRVEDGVIQDIAFQGQGCAISTASASLMTTALKGKRLEEAEALFGRFHDMVTGNSEMPADMGKLAVLTGVRDFPSRVKCATLAWHAMQAALHNQDEPVVTE
ncbi:MAG: SUF system NifU family Fe-S cluster assembly protein [Candidatus Competibacterales bacterium]|nr:SUF system NifU family Fe-S cluster assembly protein [Candidatus Competibacterales bacterium]